MADGDETQTPLKDYWASLQSNISKASKRVKESSVSAAKSASEWGADTSQKLREEMDRRRLEKSNIDMNETEQLRQGLSKDILPVTEHIPPQITIPVEEYDSLKKQITELQKECQHQMNLVEEMQHFTDELVQRDSEEKVAKLVVIEDEKPMLVSDFNRQGLVTEMKNSMDQILISLGVSVVWAALLLGLDLYLDSLGYMYQGYSLSVIIWPLGTALWSLFILTRLTMARTILSMEWPMRIKTAIGIGLTTELAMILMNEDMQAITNVWGWSATIALTAFLLSGFLRGIGASFSRIFRLKSGKESTIIDITDQ
tara:strand:+ start:2093 stop:3031 length:939 start_codon:yes stop_codon:yes gene_type:complete